jgi:hypothetical protein
MMTDALKNSFSYRAVSFFMNCVLLSVTARILCGVVAGTVSIISNSYASSGTRRVMELFRPVRQKDIYIPHLLSGRIRATVRNSFVFRILNTKI